MDWSNNPSDIEQTLFHSKKETVAILPSPGMIVVSEMGIMFLP